MSKKVLTGMSEMMDEDGSKAGSYTWESEYEKTWEVLQEDAGGSLQASVDSIIHQAKRRRLLERPVNVRLGMMRHMYVIVDLSANMEEQDVKPTRQICALKLLESFVDEYFDQNPISQLGLVVTRNKKAEKLTELGGNPRRHIAALRQASHMLCGGEPSLQNALTLCMDTLKHMPSHTSKEILVVYGSLTTCDSSNIFDTIQELKSAGIRCSVVGLSAEVHVCKVLSDETGGEQCVMLSDAHLRDLLLSHVSPPAAGPGTDYSLIRMGFPPHQDPLQERETPSLCVCHMDTDSALNKLGTVGYLCPQCGSKYCELPVECKTCGLILVSAPHLARSYHHLFPLEAFTEVPSSGGRDKWVCGGCNKRVVSASADSSNHKLPQAPVATAAGSSSKDAPPVASISGGTGYSCPQCHTVYCVDCDLFIHSTLHSCPGCVNTGRST